jgi:hypothetical protein
MDQSVVLAGLRLQLLCVASPCSPFGQSASLPAFRRRQLSEGSWRTRKRRQVLGNVGRRPRIGRGSATSQRVPRRAGALLRSGLYARSGK